jgi:DNA helicase-2/ATP-dependent DNA helicase PcrA
MREYHLRTDLRARSLSVDYEKELNEEQLEVVMAGPGPILVIAGAGSGKTRTLTYRVARLLESGVDPSSILLLTFTNKAAREMLHRVELLIKGDIKRVWGGTFHHLGNAILRRHAKLLGYGSNYAILDREDTRTMLDSCTAELRFNVKERRFPKGDVLADILSLAANTEKSINSIVEAKYPFFLSLVPEIEKVASHYKTKKKEASLVDFDDLLLHWKILLTEFPQLGESYSRKFKHILVDEYQDTNLIQAEIVDCLAGTHGNLMVVGDDAQSIYSFRGANFANIIEFPKRHPNARIYKLTINYRSTPEILNLANASISLNQRQYPKELRAINKPGKKPALVPVENVFEQAEFVAQRILELRDEGWDLNEIAVLYRSHYHSMELQLELTRREVPFEVRSGLKFFEQAHLKDVLAYLRLIYNPLDELSWKRTLKLIPQVGNVTAEKVWQFIKGRGDPMEALRDEEAVSRVPSRAQGDFRVFRERVAELQQKGDQAPADMIEHILERGYKEYLVLSYPNYMARTEDIRQLANFALRYDSLARLLGELSLLSDIAAEHPIAGGVEDERVALSSVHQAKGLEWAVVFIIWLIEGKFPSLRSIQDESSEEERRLFYVASTRAKEELYLCYPLFAQEGNRRAVLQTVSRFVGQVPEDCYESWRIINSWG